MPSSIARRQFLMDEHSKHRNTSLLSRGQPKRYECTVGCTSAVLPSPWWSRPRTCIETKHWHSVRRSAGGLLRWHPDTKQQMPGNGLVNRIASERLLQPQRPNCPAHTASHPEPGQQYGSAHWCNLRHRRNPFPKAAAVKAPLHLARGANVTLARRPDLTTKPPDQI